MSEKFPPESKDWFALPIRPNKEALEYIDSATSIQWHSQLRAAKQLLIEYSQNLDKETAKFPWFESATSSAKLNHKAGVLNHINELLALEDSIHASLKILMANLAERDPYRLDALYTFLALASMMMVNKIRGEAVPFKNHIILDFFPDVPKSSRLFNLAPFRSAFGITTFEERYFVRCRVGTAEGRYQNIYMPEHIAVKEHDVREPLSIEICTKWVAPQLALLYDEPFDPRNKYRVWVLRDEDGDEKYLGSDEPVWRKKKEREEANYIQLDERLELVSIDGSDSVVAMYIGDVLPITGSDSEASDPVDVLSDIHDSKVEQISTQGLKFPYLKEALDYLFSISLKRFLVAIMSAGVLLLIDTNIFEVFAWVFDRNQNTSNQSEISPITFPQYVGLGMVLFGTSGRFIIYWREIQKEKQLAKAYFAGTLHALIVVFKQDVPTSDRDIAFVKKRCTAHAEQLAKVAPAELVQNQTFRLILNNPPGYSGDQPYPGISVRDLSILFDKLDRDF